MQLFFFNWVQKTQCNISEILMLFVVFSFVTPYDEISCVIYVKNRLGFITNAYHNLI